jgi:hypothetical protein
LEEQDESSFLIKWKLAYALEEPNKEKGEEQREGHSHEIG